MDYLNNWWCNCKMHTLNWHECASCWSFPVEAFQKKRVYRWRRWIKLFKDLTSIHQREQIGEKRKNDHNISAWLSPVCQQFRHFDIPIKSNLLNMVLKKSLKSFLVSGQLLLKNTLSNKILTIIWVFFPPMTRRQTLYACGNIFHGFVVSWFRGGFSLFRCSPLPSFSWFSSVLTPPPALGISLSSIFMLRCWGDATSWDFFTALPERLSVLPLFAWVSLAEF